MPPKSTRVEAICRHCGEHFLTHPSRVASERGVFCSTPCMYAGRRRPTRQRLTYQQRIERFWAQADQSGNDGACWLWKGYSLGRREPRAYCKWEGKTQIAARVAWTLTHGPIPVGMLVCHNCPGGDNPLCINPAHLWLGSPADNSRDMVTKGRAKRGERSSNAILTDSRVRAIRDAHERHGLSISLLARMLGMTRYSVRAVITRQTWRDI